MTYVREIPFGIDKTDGSHAQLTRYKEAQMRFAIYCIGHQKTFCHEICSGRRPLTYSTALYRYATGTVRHRTVRHVTYGTVRYCELVITREQIASESTGICHHLDISKNG